MRQAVNPADMEAVGARHKRFMLRVDMRCACKGCVPNYQKAMNSIGSFSGVEKWVGDIDTGIVTVTGKVSVNQTELCKSLKKVTGKHVEIVCPDLPPENCKQKTILGRGSSSGTGSTTRSAPSSRSCPSAPHSDRMQQIDDEIGDLQKERDRLIIKEERKKMAADNCRFNQLINDTEKVVPDSALNNLEPCCLQKTILDRGSSSGTGSTTRSSPSSRSCPSAPPFFDRFF